MVYRPVTRQRPRSRQLCSRRCYVMCLQTTAFTRQCAEARSRENHNRHERNNGIATGTAFSVQSMPKCYKKDEFVDIVSGEERVGW